MPLNKLRNQTTSDEKDREAIIYTIGHSTHPMDVFIGMLKDFHVRKLIDVRTIPKSGFNPQYNQEVLAQSLASEDIEYEHMPGLGGLRHAQRESINKGWRNASFRNLSKRPRKRRLPLCVLKPYLGVVTVL